MERNNGKPGRKAPITGSKKGRKLWNSSQRRTYRGSKHRNGGRFKRQQDTTSHPTPEHTAVCQVCEGVGEPAAPSWLLGVWTRELLAIANKMMNTPTFSPAISVWGMYRHEKRMLFAVITCTNTTKDTTQTTSQQGLVHHRASEQRKTTQLLEKGMRLLSIMELTMEKSARCKYAAGWVYVLNATLHT